MNDHTARLQNTFTTTFDLPSSTDFLKVEYRKTSGWDSVAHMQLIAAIEDEFDIMMDTDDVIAMSSFRKAVQILEKYTDAT